MTISKHGRSYLDPIKINPNHMEVPPLMRFGVVVRNKQGVMLLGHAVTHLSAQEWADLHSYTLIKTYAKGLAFPHQRTNLF
jgi:hypothetical protein